MNTNKKLLSLSLGLLSFAAGACSQQREEQRMKQITNEIDFGNKYIENHGLIISEKKITFNTDGAIKFSGFANGKNTCLITGKFYAILAELYRAIKYNETTSLEEISGFYVDLLRYAIDFPKSHITARIVTSKPATEEETRALIFAIEHIKKYKDLKLGNELLEKVKELTEDIVGMSMEKLRLRIEIDTIEDKFDDSEWEKTEQENGDYKKLQNQERAIIEYIDKKYPHRQKEEIWKYVDIKFTKKKNNNYEKICKNWQNKLYGFLNFINPITYMAIKTMEGDSSEISLLERMFDPHSDIKFYSLDNRERLTGLYVYEFLVKPFLGSETSKELDFEYEKIKEKAEVPHSRNLNIELEGKKTLDIEPSSAYRSLKKEISKLKFLFNIMFLEHNATGPHEGIHYTSFLQEEALSIEDICQIAHLFSEIIGYEWYASPEKIYINECNDLKKLVSLKSLGIDTINIKSE